MRVFQMVMAVLFCAALTFYLWVAVPRVQAQDTSMPVLTDETDGENLIGNTVSNQETVKKWRFIVQLLGKRAGHEAITQIDDKLCCRHFHKRRFRSDNSQRCELPR